MERGQLIAGLRAAADLYEQHPEIPEPCSVDLLAYVFGKDAKAQLLAAMRAMGHAEKNHADNNFIARRRMNAGDGIQGVFISVLVDRDVVCRKIVTKKIVPAEPERVLPALPEREVEETAWECGEPILAGVAS